MKEWKSEKDGVEMNGRRRCVAAVLAGWLAIALIAAGSALPARAQGDRGDNRGLEETIWAIQRARVVTRILYITAHPDDEPFPLLTYLARGRNADVALLAITRGEGGQNAVGPEQGAGLGMLRTEELLAATRAYGIRLFFTRAPDFGYSKSPEETLKIWGREAYDDVVQVIRAYRPHIVINHWGGVRGGHGHHVSAGLLTPKAVESAADPEYIVLNVDRGLDPWKVDLLLQPARGDAAGAMRLPADEVSPLWGRSYVEIGRDGFINHRTQGIAGFLTSPFLRRSVGLLSPDGKGFDAAQLAAPLVSLAARFPERAAQLRPMLEECDALLVEAEGAARQLEWPAAARALAKAGQLVGPMSVVPFNADAARSQLSWELNRINERIESALRLAAGFRMEATADRNLIVPGGKFGVRAEWRHRPGIAVEMVQLRPVMRPGESTPVEIPNPRLFVPRGWAVTQEPPPQTGSGQAQAPATTARFTVSVPAGAKTPAGVDAWMQPWLAPTVGASAMVIIEGYRMWVTSPATVRRASSTNVETAPLTLVPAASVALQPRQIFLRAGQVPPRMEILARVHYFGAEATKLAVGIEAPKGWKVSAEQTVEFAEAGDELLKFTVTPPPSTTGPPSSPKTAASAGKLAVGTYELKAYAKRGEEIFSTSIEPLPSLGTRYVSEPAVAQVQVMELEVPAGLRVGYVAAENDPIPGVLAQLGVRVEMLDEVPLAFGELSRYDAICIGIRAYELRSDLARANPRLLDYARAGGTLVVQYQREGTWNALNPAPYPAKVGQPTVRTSDENSPVRIIWPNHSVVRYPNPMRPGDFEGWVQERGLYYWGTMDKQYVPILGLRDPGEEETLGGLVYAAVGKGHYIYTGLSFFRQLPAGVPGAVRLFVNLVSQGKTPVKK